MSSRNYLFIEGQLSNSIAAQREKLVVAVNKLMPNQLLEAVDGRIEAHFVAEYKINPIELHEEALELIEPREIETKHVSSTFHQEYTKKSLEFRFELPFSGDPILLKLQPSTFNMSPPSGEIEGRKLVFVYQRSDRDHEALKRDLSGNVNSIKAHLNWQRPEIDRWNKQLPEFVGQQVAARKNKLLADRELIDGLGFRIRKRGQAPAASAVPIERKIVIPPPEPRYGAASPNDQYLDAAVYEDILDTLAGMSVVIERSPSAFVGLDEEALRTHFLVPLNSNYKGLATGETFNAVGKTDILIKHEDRILFVAECKFWKGAQSLTDAITQLLSYLTWREAKAAILLFNRNRNFSAVLAQIPDVFSAHPQFVRAEKYKLETGYRFILRHPNDAQRFLTVTLLAFDVPRGE